MKINILKKIITVTFVIVFLVNTFVFPVDATESYDFANFTESDSMHFVETHSIEIPYKLQNSEYLPAFTREVILQAYNDPYEQFNFNYFETQTYAEEIRLAVASYINPDANPITKSSPRHYLQYNTVKDENGNWVTSGGAFDSKWLGFNCYAFAINRAEKPNYYYYNPQMIQYQPGDMSGQGTFGDCSNINQLADIVCADLVAMGYSNVSLSSTIPDISSSQELICVRMLADFDYHFMRYDIETDAWYHKPGKTAVLKYNYVPSNSALWYAEYCTEYNTYPAFFAYDSDIVFIAYSKNQINVPECTESREYIQPGKDVFCEINIASADWYSITLSSLHSFEYEIYDADFDLLSSGTGYADTSMLSMSVGKYYLRINFETNNLIHYVDVEFAQHEHEYGRYFYHNNTSHRKSCASCDSIKLEGHYVKYSGIVDGRYAICLGCRTGLDFFEDTAQVIRDNIKQMSINGSHILSNGIVVLVDEDVDAYTSGTLKFYDINNLPVTE